MESLSNRTTNKTGEMKFKKNFLSTADECLEAQGAQWWVSLAIHWELFILEATKTEDVEKMTSTSGELC